MYTKIAFFLFVILHSLKTVCQVGSKIESTNMVYEFINSRYTSQTKMKYLSQIASNSQMEYFGRIIREDSNFSNANKLYMLEQVKNSSGFFWDQEKLSNLKVIDSIKLKNIFRDENGWKRFRRKYGKNCMRIFAVPIFTLDKRFCIFHWHIQCDCTTGDGAIILLEKINDKYVEVKGYLKIVS